MKFITDIDMRYESDESKVQVLVYLGRYILEMMVEAINTCRYHLNCR